MRVHEFHGEAVWPSEWTAVFTVVMALATIGLAIAAWKALGQVHVLRGQITESRQARMHEAFAELGRRWDGDEMIQSRALVDSVRDHLVDEIGSGFDAPTEDYYRLLREPHYLEDVAYLCRENVIDADKLANSLGLLVIERWNIWRDAILYLRERRGAPEAFEHFEWLAAEMEAHFARRRAKGPSNTAV